VPSLQQADFFITSSLALSRERANVYGWIGGDRPSDVLEQAKARKAQGFTAVKMNAVESVSVTTMTTSSSCTLEMRSVCWFVWYVHAAQLGWLDSPHALEATIQRVKDVKSIGIDVGL
jgi:galactonate dehydratase